MKVVILTSETTANVWLVNQLLAACEVAGIVIERRPLAITRSEKFQRRLEMLRRHGFLRTINKLIYNSLRWRFLGRAEAKVIREHFFPGGAPANYARSLPTLVVPTVNDPSCAAFIRAHSADVVAVCGTTVLRPEIFSLPPKGTVNIHTGITPEYRSADPIFWALYCGEPDKVGVTIHYIDRGIDTGPVIRQERVPVYADDTLVMLYTRCIRRGAELYLRALADIEAGAVRMVDRSGATSRAFRSIDLGIVEYLLFRARFRKLLLRLPRQPRAATQRVPGVRR